MKFSYHIKSIRLTLFILIAILFIGCSASTTVTMKDYADQKSDGKSLGIITLFNYPDIENKKDITDDLGPGNPYKVYMNFFNQRVKSEILDYGG